MTKGYSGASFSTKGNWLIPMILGWSKSVVSMGRPIGIMFTLHITPYLNIGFNNPRPKYKPMKQTTHHCCCNCHEQDNYDHYEDNSLPYDTYLMAEEFVMNSEPEKVFGVVPIFDESGKPELHILVASKDVEIPDRFDDIPTVKKVTPRPEAFNKNES